VNEKVTTDKAEIGIPPALPEIGWLLLMFHPASTTAVDTCGRWRIH